MTGSPTAVDQDDTDSLVVLLVEVGGVLHEAEGHRGLAECRRHLDGEGRGLAALAVFEDDAALPADCAARIAAALLAARCPLSWDLLLLGYWDRSLEPPERRTVGAAHAPPGGVVGVQRVTAWWGMHAYLVSRRGMRRIVELNTPVRGQIDGVLSQAAAHQRLDVLGITHRGQRVQQHGHGSDVAMPLRPGAGKTSAGEHILPTGPRGM